MLLRYRDDVEVRIEHPADALEGDDRLDHQHQLEGEVHPVLHAARDRLEDELAERRGVLGGVAPEAAGDVGDLAGEALRVRLRPRLRDAGQVARGGLRFADHQAVEVEEQVAPQVLVEAPDLAEVDEADARAGHHEEVPRMQVGVEEAVAVEHPDDGARAEVDDVRAVRGRELLRLGGSGLVAAQELHAQQVRGAVGAEDAREDDFGLVGEVGGEGLGVVGL